MADGAVGGGVPVRIRDLLPEDSLFRAILKRSWLDNLIEAFMLRAGEDGLSVCFDCAPHECLAILGLNRLHGVASLLVVSATELGLTVAPDEPHHALIIGIPHKEDDPARAEWIAGQLAERAAVVDRTRRERTG